MFEQPDAAGCPACGAPRPRAGWPADPRLGTIVAGGQFRVTGRLGAGGFGTVYRVETVVGGLQRALKVLHPHWAADPRTRERFVNEALVLEQLNHPNIARCYAAGTLDGGHDLYLLLELVEGAPLSSVIGGPGQQALDPLRAVRLAKQVASGLVVVHRNEVLHRDLTPQNVLVTRDATGAELVKLVDFGIADALEADTVTGGTIIGTPIFLPPEQLAGGPAADRRADLWQLGALLYMMLTGRPPYAPGAGGLADLLASHAAHRDAGPAPSARCAATRACPALDVLVQRLLASSAERRPRSAAQVCEELAHIEHLLAPGGHADGPRALLEALAAQPGEHAWWAICRHLEGHPEAERLAEAADALLAGWPDALRRAPLHWWDAVKRGAPHRLWPLARTLDLSGLGIGDEEIEAVVSQPALSTITRLSLARNQLGPAGAAVVAAATSLRGLVSLDLSDNRIGSVGTAAIAASEALARVVVLDVAGNGLGARGAEALAAARMTLRELDASDNDLGPDGAAALAGSAAMAGLERLSIADNAIGSDGLGALAVSRTIVALRHLDASHNGIGAGGAAALALSHNLGALAALSLARNPIGLEGAGLLLASNRFAALECLDLSSTGLGASGAMSLASWPFARRLKRLAVSDNDLGDAGLAALLGGPFLSGLRSLAAAQNRITAAGVSLVGGAPPELDTLDLSANPLGAEGATALAAVLPRLRLRSLALDDCGLGGRGLAVVLAATPATLERLSAAGNGLGPDGARVVAGVDAACRPGAVDLSRNALGPEGLDALTRAAAFAGVRSAALASNGLGTGDGTAMAGALDRLAALDRLVLADNAITDGAAAALAVAATAGRLAALDLSLNRIEDAGASALARGAWPCLRALDLDRNGLGLGAAASLVGSPGLPVLCRAGFTGNAIGGRIDLRSLSRRTVERLEASFAEVSADGAGFAERFYTRLFERYPSLKPLFAHVSMRRQQQHLLQALTLVIDHLRAPDLVTPQLEALAVRHAGYGAYPSQYQIVTAVILDTLRETLGARWTDEVEAAWHDGLEAIAAVMIGAGAPGGRQNQESRIENQATEAAASPPS
ncbi:MAG: protein kinase [Vicinamibacterales bacterium]